MHVPHDGQAAKLYSEVQRKLNRKSSRRSIVRWGFLSLNLLLLVGTITFVINANTSRTSSQPTLNAAVNSQVSNPLDQLSSANIAVTVANMDNLTEKAGVTNQAQSANAELNTAVVTDNVSSKPQVVTTAFKSNKDIHKYVVQPGDTIASIAAKFNVTSNSVKWSNGLGSTVQTGVTLWIPPNGVSGIVYTVKAGDTPSSLASKFQASESQIIAYNDAELSGLQVGERIIIPNGTQPAPVFASYGYFAISTASYAGNDYDFGWCTWYVYNRRAAIGRPVPSNLGNANTWYTIARAIGLPTGFTPQVGAVMVNQPHDHVAVVESVNADGSYIVSEMNSYGWDSPQTIGVAGHQTGGWGRVDYKTYPADSGMKFIY